MTSVDGLFDCWVENIEVSDWLPEVMGCSLHHVRNVLLTRKVFITVVDTPT